MIIAGSTLPLLRCAFASSLVRVPITACAAPIPAYCSVVIAVSALFTFYQVRRALSNLWGEGDPCSRLTIKLPTTLTTPRPTLPRSLQLLVATQEMSTSAVLASFRSLIPLTAIVIRGGVPARIKAHELVVGDIVQLETGQRVPAGASFCEACAC